jgi:hypothetical protein
MINLCEVTVPGLRVAEVPALRRLLVGAFANVRGVVGDDAPGHRAGGLRRPRAAIGLVRRDHAGRLALPTGAHGSQ